MLETAVLFSPAPQAQRLLLKLYLTKPLRALMQSLQSDKWLGFVLTSKILGKLGIKDWFELSFPQSTLALPYFTKLSDELNLASICQHQNWFDLTLSRLCSSSNCWLYNSLVTVSRCANASGKRDYGKVDCCFFCKKLIASKISRHYLNVHVDREAVKQIVLASGKDRAKKLYRLQQLGNFEHNTRVSNIILYY